MLVNARILQAPLTGVNRYLGEVLSAWPGPAPTRIDPPSWAAAGARGHLWEQTVLPLRSRGQLLWSPVHSGPMMLESQVVTVHDLVPLDHPEWVSARFARWYRFMLPRLVHRARHLIAISEFTRSRLVEATGVDEQRISVIPNGVSERFRPASEEDGRAMRQALGLGDDPYLLSLGSLEPRKNLPRLLDAWSRALPQLPNDLRLVVAGAAGRASVFGRAESMTLPERVIALGRVDDRWLPALYTQADWFVYLSLYEGFGLPPLEALACGTPVLVSAIDVFREVVGDAGVTVEPDDMDAIASMLGDVARDSGLRATLAARAEGQAAGMSWERTAERTRQVLLQHR